ncbi:MAG: DMT family transporter [Eubacteriales bacterium]
MAFFYPSNELLSCRCVSSWCSCGSRCVSSGAGAGAAPGAGASAGGSSFLTQAGLTLFASVPILYNINLSTLPWLLYCGGCVSGLAYMFYFLAMESTSAATASITFFIKPALASILALIILNEAITINMFIGILLITAGSLIAFIYGSKQRKSNELNQRQ